MGSFFSNPKGRGPRKRVYFIPHVTLLSLRVNSRSGIPLVHRDCYRGRMAPKAVQWCTAPALPIPALPIRNDALQFGLKFQPCPCVVKALHVLLEVFALL